MRQSLCSRQTDSMLLCPEQTQTSPKSTPESVTVFPADVAAIVWLANPAAVAGSSLEAAAGGNRGK